MVNDRYPHTWFVDLTMTNGSLISGVHRTACMVSSEVAKELFAGKDGDIHLILSQDERSAIGYRIGSVAAFKLTPDMENVKVVHGE